MTDYSDGIVGRPRSRREPEALRYLIARDTL